MTHRPNPDLPHEFKLPESFIVREEVDGKVEGKLRPDIQAWTPGIVGKWETTFNERVIFLESGLMGRIQRLTGGDVVSNRAIIKEQYIAFERKEDAALFKTFWL